MWMFTLCFATNVFGHPFHRHGNFFSFGNVFRLLILWIVSPVSGSTMLSPRYINTFWFPSLIEGTGSLSLSSTFEVEINSFSTSGAPDSLTSSNISLSVALIRVAPSGRSILGPALFSTMMPLSISKKISSTSACSSLPSPLKTSSTPVLRWKGSTNVYLVAVACCSPLSEKQRSFSVSATFTPDRSLELLSTSWCWW